MLLLYNLNGWYNVKALEIIWGSETRNSVIYDGLKNDEKRNTIYMTGKDLCKCSKLVGQYRDVEISSCTGSACVQECFPS